MGKEMIIMVNHGIQSWNGESWTRQGGKGRMDKELVGLMH